ncbi:toll/interleukin-1 receptor domain-containing protein [Nostoc sp. ChiQUE01b]|uniref:toll/interleukin-1 receptor domain-containing protein n=1 Tax=Nostoc sp. ChiQUE01b TaxID=3075376 RepID=UPI002AD4F936|nr:toll/interleukin-1 receptor domain-containing protein [Nostoc sp. ChiQUE01b]MDZ8264403.1 toll/interleukin-1 receptor domain-containing protein [Nostoc sp. ChiQUE01b]
MRVFVIGGTTADPTEPMFKTQKALLEQACYQLGCSLGTAGHSVIVCSPFENSADIEVMRGFAETLPPRPAIEIHYPDSQRVNSQFNEVLSRFQISTVSRYPYPPPQVETREAFQYAWLLCQLNAIERSHLTIAIGGKPDGAANMLLLIAEGKQKPLLPISFLGGAASQSFYRRRYELTDRLGEDIDALQDSQSINKIVYLAERLVDRRSTSTVKIKGNRPNFFISYPRARPAEADYVETILRRRNMVVFRDETDFGAGYDIPRKIQEAVFSADVFVALWCREYACSPWCFDEMELALEKHAQSQLELWIFCVDDTRIIPRRARDLVFYQIKSRDELEGRIVTLLERMENTNSKK